MKSNIPMIYILTYSHLAGQDCCLNFPFGMSSLRHHELHHWNQHYLDFWVHRQRDNPFPNLEASVAVISCIFFTQRLGLEDSFSHNF